MFNNTSPINSNFTIKQLPWQHLIPSDVKGVATEDKSFHTKEETQRKKGCKTNSKKIGYKTLNHYCTDSCKFFLQV